MIRIAVLCLLLPAIAAAAPTPRDAEACVALGLGQSAEIAVASAKVDQYRARLAEVQSNYGWRLGSTAFVAPTFAVKGDAVNGVTRSFKPQDWGPYAHLEALLVKPLYTFGRVEAGERAARSRMMVEQARVTAAENVVALSIRRLYFTELYARSMRPSLRFGTKLLTEAYTQAQALYEAADASVTQADLMRLRYGQAELRRFQRQASDGAELAHLALKQAMGLPAGTALVLAHEKLPKISEEMTERPLAYWLVAASKSRPEWTMLKAGRAAALSLAEAERLSNAPAMFLAGSLQADWSPVREDSGNPYHFDPYNRVIGGVAIGISWDFQPARAAAKTEQAEALSEEVAGLRRFAETGVPLQVQKAYQQVERTRTMLTEANEGVKATRKWMTFAAAAYKTGTGEARDLLEGLVAHLSAKRTKYETLRDYHHARAELLFATGVKPKPEQIPERKL